MDYLYITIIGLVIGSFLNVCIYRIPLGESIIVPSSHCPKCNHKLSVLELIQVLSYFILRGRCKYCKQKISIQYPIIEILNALLYVMLYYKFGFTFNLLKYSIFASILIVIAMIDGKTKYVYISTTMFTFVVGIFFIIIEAIVFKERVLTYITASLIGFSIITFIVILTRAMGEGDIEIASVCGLFLGTRLFLLGLFLSIIIGGITGTILLITNRKSRKDEMAFGPSLSMGAVISLLIGGKILSYYMYYFS